MRQESSPGFAKVIGTFDRIYYVPKFTDAQNILNSDYTDATSVSFINYRVIYRFENYFEVDKCMTIDENLVPFTGYVCNTSSLRDNSNKYLTQVGALMTVSRKQGICACISLNKEARVYIRFLDSNNNNITDKYASTNIGYQLSYYPTHKAFVSTTDVASHQIHIPTNKGGVEKIFIGCNTGQGVILKVYSNVTVETPSIPTKGPTAKRPKGLPVGVSYFDTDLKMPIWWDGKRWMDATGNSVR